MPATAQGTPAAKRSECFARAAAYRGMAGFEKAASAAEALNSASDDATRQKALGGYDTALGAAISATGTSKDVVAQLLKLESLVDRIGECATALAMGSAAPTRSDHELRAALKRNIAYLDPQLPPEQMASADKKQWHSQFYSQRVRDILAEGGQGTQIAVIEQALEKREEDRWAAGRAAWAAGAEARKAEESARWREQEAIAARQKTAQAIPDEELIRRVIIGEAQASLGNSAAFVMSRFLDSGFSSASTDYFKEDWNADAGYAVFDFGSGLDRMHQELRWSVSNLSCTPKPQAQPAYQCAFDATLFAWVTMAGADLLNSTSPKTRLNTLIIWDGARWTAPSIRAAMERGLANGAVASKPNYENQSTSSLCKSLSAGVVAVGGNSTSQAWNPSTWGC